MITLPVLIHLLHNLGITCHVTIRHGQVFLNSCTRNH